MTKVKAKTKAQVWAEAQKILEELGLSKTKHASAITAFEALLAPKKAGGMSRPEPLEVDGVKYYYCRFTGLYMPSSEMVYQNDEKRDKLEDKGYSKIGISIWNKGQKYLKDMKMKSVEIAYGDDQSDEKRAEGMKLHKDAVEIEKNNYLNSHEWLMENMLSEEQADYLETLELPAAK